jgi:hypothetical protein
MSFKYKVKDSYSLEELQELLEQKEKFVANNMVPKTQYEEVLQKNNLYEEEVKTNQLKEQFVNKGGDITQFNKFKKLYEGEEIEDFKKENGFLFKDNAPTIEAPKEEEKTEEPKTQI